MILSILFLICYAGMVVCGIIALISYAKDNTKMFSHVIVGVVVFAIMSAIFGVIRGYHSDRERTDICPRCETQIEEEYNFCSNCGAELKE